MTDFFGSLFTLFIKIFKDFVNYYLDFFQRNGPWTFDKQIFMLCVLGLTIWFIRSVKHGWMIVLFYMWLHIYFDMPEW